jgi:outer membrane protein assembly complex protein YaeT
MTATDRASPAALRAAGVLAALLLGVATAPAQAPPAADRCPVHDVVILGNRLVATAAVMGRLRTRPGSEYAQETVNDDVRRLYETHQFADIRVEVRPAAGGAVDVCFRLVECGNPIREIVYQGAKHLKQDDLNTVTGLRKGMPLNPVANQAACQAVERRYHEDGRLFATCVLVEGGRPDDSRVVFDIAEGPVIKVSAIDFAGGTFVSNARLRTQVNSGAEWFPRLLGIGGTYSPMMAQYDALKLEEYYRSFGFQDVHVAFEPVYQDDGKHVRLVYHIEEGQRYRVKDVVVAGARTFDQQQIAALPKLHPGEFYNDQQAEADAAAIKDYYGYAGYLTHVKKELFYPEPGLCLVRYTVTERPPARVGQVHVVGNTVTRQDVILRQLPLYPGQVLSYPDLKTAEKNLERLGIFNDPTTGARPTVTVIEPEGDGTFQDILVQVQEQRTSSLLFGLGVNSDTGVTGNVVFNERNFDITRFPTSFDDLLEGRAFRGGGQEFRLEAMPGTQVQRYLATWRDPSLFDSPYGLSLSGYYFTHQYNEYDESRLGTRISVERKLGEHWTVSETVRVEDVGVQSIHAFAPEDFTSVAGQNLLVGLRTGVTYDNRDSILRPTEGNRLDVSFEEVTGDYTFPIVRAQLDKYWTVFQRPDGSGRHVLALRSQVGWETSNAPVFERFYAGGFDSMRGFAFRGVGPNVNGFETGGDFLFLNSLEYQVPLRANDQLYLVAFVDSGTVEPTPELKDYRVSAGFGLRFVVPMLGPVPIALDFGFPIVRGPGDHEQVFSFALGFFH